MASKSPQAFRTIREVADWLGIEAHVLRFWESKFNQIKPVKRAGGRRYYRPADMRLVGGIKILLHDQGLTIRGVQKMIREEGVGHVAGLSPALDEDLLDGELIEAAADAAAPAEPEPQTPAEPTTGFFDVDAMAGVEAETPTPQPTAEPEPALADATLEAPAPVDTKEPAETLEEAPEPTAATPAPQEPPVEPAAAATDQPEQDADAPLSSLRTLLDQHGPLNPDQQAALAPHVVRLQVLADKLTARSRAS